MFIKSIKNDLKRWLRDLPNTKDKDDYIKYSRIEKLAQYKANKIRKKILRETFIEGAKYVYEYDGRIYRFEKYAMIFIKKDGTKGTNNHRYYIALSDIPRFKKI